jgi:alkyl sulfatase BDS1-like metallo-beta-lactamase superfamily hydrolase
MADLLALSSRIIDSGEQSEPTNRVTNELTELADDLAVVESFSHCVVWNTGDGLVCFDTSGPATGAAVVEAVRRWSLAPVTHVVYTHGHADHVGGSGFFAADAQTRGHRPASVVGHRRVPDRMARYPDMSNWNVAVNTRQFGGINPKHNMGVGAVEQFLPAATLAPDRLIDDHELLYMGSGALELFHDRGETDDHLWGWIPEKRWLLSGDFMTWTFPNAGNPQKVQRYPLDWARALRRMAALRPELLLPAHGLPIAGVQRIGRVLHDIADTVETLVGQVVDMMNADATLDQILHEVTVPPDVLARPYLRPVYDEPEFMVRNIWRLYGGWWDGAASRLKPSPDAQVASVIAELAGGPRTLTDRAERAVGDGDLRLACHLVDLAAWAAPDDPAVHGVRAEVYSQRRRSETSLMAKGIFAAAARQSRHVSDTDTTTPEV